MEHETQEKAPQTTRRGLWRRWMLIPIMGVILLAGILYWLSGQGLVSTDDAQIEGDLVPISPRVSGYVDTIAVDDNDQVKPGQLLVQLDRRDLETRVHQAEANLLTLQAQSAAASQQVSITAQTAPARERQAGAAVTSAQAGVSSAESQISLARAQLESAHAGVETAQGAVTAAQSQIRAAQEQIRAAEAASRAAQANVTSAQAQATRTASDLARYRQLYSGGAVSKQQYEAAVATNTSAQSALQAARDQRENAQAAVAQARAGLASAQAGLKQAQGRLTAAQAAVRQANAGVRNAQSARSQAQAGVQQAQAGESAVQTAPQQIATSIAQSKAAAAQIRQAQANLRNARLQLSYTRIAAPVDGIVSKKNVQLGQFVQPGQLLMALVPLRNVWVVANFKETDIGQMHPGQPARLRVDTYPGREFTGKVQSIGAATGAKFSLLPPENATGNFVKVVQRIPVKIVFDQPLPPGVTLRPGLNVEATVNVR